MKPGLRSSLEKLVPDELPGYEFYSGNSEYVWSGEVVLATRREGVSFFVVFSPHTQDTRGFTVDVGWSRLNRFPEIDMRPCADKPDSQHTEFGQDEYFTRVGLVSGGAERWWKRRVGDSFDAPLESALDCVREVAPPYFERMLASGGSSQAADSTPIWRSMAGPLTDHLEVDPRNTKNLAVAEVIYFISEVESGGIMSYVDRRSEQNLLRLASGAEEIDSDHLQRIVSHVSAVVSALPEAETYSERTFLALQELEQDPFHAVDEDFVLSLPSIEEELTRYVEANFANFK